MKNHQQQKGKGVGGGGDDGNKFRRIRVKRGNKRSRFFMLLGPSDSDTSSVDHSSVGSNSFPAGPSVDHQNPTTNNNKPQLQQQVDDGFQIKPERPNIRTRIRTITTMRINPQVLLQQVGFQINQEIPIQRRRRRRTATPATTTTTTTTPPRQQQYYRCQCPFHPPLSAFSPPPPPQTNFSSTYPPLGTTSIPRNNDEQSSSSSSIST